MHLTRALRDPEIFAVLPRSHIQYSHSGGQILLSLASSDHFAILFKCLFPLHLWVQLSLGPFLSLAHASVQKHQYSTSARNMMLA